MSTSVAGEVTVYLMEWQRGDQHALDRLLPVVYGELQRLAAAYLRGERKGHTLQPTALVHEAYLRLVNQKTPQLRSRSHFFGVAAHVMRQVLVDAARTRNAQKRNGGEQVPLEKLAVCTPDRPADILALDDALSDLARVSARKCQVIEMRYFGGLSNDEIAEALGVSVATVVRDRRFAEVWFQQRLSSDIQ